MTTSTIPEVAACAAAEDAPAFPSAGASTGARADQGGAGARSRLQDDEVAALAAIASGATVRRAARLLGVSEHTYRRRVTAAVDALGATSTVNAVHLATLAGLLPADFVDAVRRGQHCTGPRARGGPWARHAATVGMLRRQARYAAHRRGGATPQQAAKAMGGLAWDTRRKYETAYQQRPVTP